jgi:uncharacterized protein DUF6600
MKTLMLRVCYLGLAVSTILASPGDKEKATTEDVNPVDPVADVLKPLQIADADALADADLPAPLAAPTNAPVKPPPMPLEEPVPPPNVKLSPALAEVIKLVQAGVSADVLLAYITNSTSVFDIDSNAIVYLNDLGVTNTVITALIQHDSSPETAARRASATAAQPLPPGLAATAPVTNVYPAPAAATRTFPAAGQTTYPGDYASMTDTNAESTNLPPAVQVAAPAENVTVNYFYSSLAPYGSWVDVDGYGLCWRPTVAVTDPYWRPYNHCGRWLWSDYGWYWYSDYSWGWGPFHYGRWCNYPRWGWVWVPGTVWSPAWVTWRYSDAYCGWAPLPPGCGWRSGIGLTWYGRGISVGFDFGLGSHCYSYVPTARFCDWHVWRHCLPENRLRVVHHNTINVNKVVVRNNTIVNQGIEPNTIARATRSKIPTMRVRDAALPVDQRVKPERLENNGNTLAVVRPQLPKTAPATANLVSSQRGTAQRGKPINLASSTPAVDRANARGQSPNATTGTPRQQANTPPMSAIRDQGNANRGETTAVGPPNSGVRTEAPNRSGNVERARPQAAPQTAAPRQQVGRSVPAEAPQVGQGGRPTPPQLRNNNAAANTPPTRNPAPAARLVPPTQNQPSTRPVPPQVTPAPRNNNNMIRSYAQPERSVPNAAPPRASQPVPRMQIPSAAPQPTYRPAPPQVSAPRAEVSRPSAAPSAPSVRSSPPQATRSAPSGGGGGGGGNRGGGGGRNRGGD